MSCRLYTATNANCIVGGEPPAGESATIREDFEAGVSLVVDTTGEETTVRGAVPAHREAPEALVGVVTGPRGDDPLRNYHDAVRDVFDDRPGWRVRTDVVNGRLFEALGRPAGPTPGEELLSSVRTHRRDGEHVEIGVPDAANAAEVLRALLDREGDGVYVISTQEPPDHVGTDVFVHLADRYTSPELVDLETDLSPGERVGRRVDELVDELPPPAVASRLESETQQRDVSLGFEADSSGGGLGRTVLAGVGIGLAVAVLLAGVGPATSGSQVTLDLGWLPIAPTLPPWAPLAAGVVAVVAAVSVPGVRRLFGDAIGIGAVLGSRRELEPEQRERLETVAAILEQQALEMDGDPYRTAKSGLKSRPIQPAQRSVVHRLVGVLGALVPAVIVVVAAWLLLGMLSTEIVTLALFAIAGVALGVRVGVTLGAVGASFGKLFSGGSSDRETNEQQRQEADDAAAERDDDDSDLGIRAADEADDGVGAGDGSNPIPDPAKQDREGGEGSEPPADDGSFPIAGSDRDDETEDGTTEPADPAGDEAGIAQSTDETEGDVGISTTDPDTPERDATDDVFGGEQRTETAGEETESDEPDHLFDTATERDGQESRDDAEEKPTTSDDERSRTIDGERSTTAGEARSDDADPTADERGSKTGVARSAGPKSTGTDAHEPTTRGPFEQFFDEYPVTMAPVVTDERVFVAGDAGLHDRSIPVDRNWLPQRHLDTVRLGTTQAHLTRLSHDGTRDDTIPFTNPFAEPIVGGDGTVYVVDSSLTVAALGEAGPPAIQTFRHEPNHFSGDRWLYVSDRRGSRILGADLQVKQELSGVFAVSPMVAGGSMTLCFEDGQSRRLDLTNNRATDFSAPAGEFVGSVVADGTPYIASESGVVWSGERGGWQKRMDAHRPGFRWLTANDDAIVMAGRSVIYTLGTGMHRVDSLETTVSSAPVVTDDSVYFASNGELVRADPELNTTARIDLPWRSVDGLAAGDDRLFVVADGAVWTAPFSAVR
jgi:hypothetical protein